MPGLEKRSSFTSSRSCPVTVTSTAEPIFAPGGMTVRSRDTTGCADEKLSKASTSTKTVTRKTNRGALTNKVLRLDFRTATRDVDVPNDLRIELLCPRRDGDTSWRARLVVPLDSPPAPRLCRP